MALNVVILAAGQGKRMYSNLPKVLHPLAGKPLLRHVVDTARGLAPARLVVVYGHGGETVRQTLDAEDIRWALQEPQLGTGHALAQALPCLLPDLPTLVLYGDVPLVQLSTLQKLLQSSNGGLGLLTMVLENPHGYGRIVRDSQGAVTAIVEERDASSEEQRIQEVNTGIMVLPADHLAGWLNGLSNHNAQGEYYLTDVVAKAVEAKVAIHTAHPEGPWEVQGVNNKLQLAELERAYQLKLAEQLLLQGVHLSDPARLDVRGTLRCGRDVSIDIGCVFEGNVELEAGVQIGPYCIIKDSVVRTGAKIAAYSHVDAGVIGPDAVVGPYARIRPGTRLEAGAHVGNFVEIKNSQIGPSSKANHLAYIGDADVGARVNIGAGTITCNYDGVNKFRTVIEDDVFIGSDSQLVAPVRVGVGATLGAGTTLTQDAPAGTLTLSRSSQATIPGWKRPEKKKM